MNRTQRVLVIVWAVWVPVLLAACARSAPASAVPATELPATASIAATATTATAATAVVTEGVAPAVATPATELQAGLAGRRTTPETAAGVAATATAATAPTAAAGTPATTAVLPTVTARPVVEQAALLPTATATRTPNAAPVARSVGAINVRSGPGTDYPVVGGLAAGAAVPIVGRDAAAGWWQVTLANGSTGWIYAPLAETAGNTAAVAVAANIPAPPTLPPPTDTPAGLAGPPTAQETAAPPVTLEPAAPEPPAPARGPDFRVVGKRLWDVYENGGFLVGDSVHCGEKRQLVVNVLDANGSRINGVAVQAEYGAREVIVTGSQGRGDGVAEFVLGGGQDVKVIRDNDGRVVTSEMATGLSTNPASIPVESLIAGQFCSDEESCRRFVDAPGCYGHYSWTVTFQRSY